MNSLHNMHAGNHISFEYELVDVDVLTVGHTLARVFNCPTGPPMFG
jgi:hypothetical protein